MPNRLAESLSPYLRQHAHNPVDWYPWGDEALSRAKREDRPIMLSIGYSACHWCHVMEHESFDNESIAALMNEFFVNIKVDREERPDLDKVYQTAVQLMTRRSGGWPLTVFLTPDLKPFYGGTYFPPEDRRGMPGLPGVLRNVAENYRTERVQLDALAQEVTDAVSTVQSSSADVEHRTAGNGKTAGPQSVSNAAKWLGLRFDTRYGGFGDAPKFPSTMALDVMLRAHARTGDAEQLARVRQSLDAMIDGGIHDQLGGGFHRYSVDARWRVPHFEKMLYDNALIGRLLVDAWRATKHGTYREAAEKLFGYVRREMQANDGGFFSSQDADSEGAEGTFFVWTPEQLQEVLGAEDAAIAGLCFGVDDDGNFEHNTTVLHRTRSLDDLAKATRLDHADLEARVGLICDRMFQAREARIKPFRDDKIIAAWNGLMISAFAEAGGAFERSDLVNVAVQALTFVRDTMFNGGILHRLHKDSVSSGDGFLTDYAEVGHAALDVCEATFDPQWERFARTLADRAIELFWDREHTRFLFGAARTDVLVSTEDLIDNATPSGTASVVQLLLRLDARRKTDAYAEITDTVLRSLEARAVDNPFAHGRLLCALDHWVRGPAQIAFVGLSNNARDELATATRQLFVPDRALIWDPDPSVATGPGEAPAAELVGATTCATTTGVFVCRDRTCSLPVTTTAELETLLATP